MEFLQKNFYDTTTQIAVLSNTATSKYLMDADLRRQYVTSGYADDSITASVTISFDSTQLVDRIAILGSNVKNFNVFYNGVTANAFTLTGPTTTSQWTGNAVENLYLQATQVACTSVTFDLKKTMTANVEKAIGQIIISANELTLSRIPAANDYTPDINPKQLTHELSSGGTRSHTVDEKWSFKLKYKYITQTFRDDLKDIYDQHEAKIFVPFGTTTGWDGVIPEVNWIGKFDFYKNSDNAVAAGYTGNIDLRET